MNFLFKIFLERSFYIFLALKNLFKSLAVGMAVAQPYEFQTDFVRNPISGSAV